MQVKKGSEKFIKFLIYLIIVVLVNIAGITLFFRLDLSANKMYSISDASKKAVSTLSEPLTIKVFFTKDLPAPHNSTERYLHDLLAEYAVHASRHFNYSFHDVSAEEGELSEESQENQKLANNYGIHPVQIQAIEKDEVKFQRAYMGLVVIHGDLIERIPTIASTEGLEYKLTTAIRKLNNKISALLRLQDKIHIKLFLSSSLNQIAPHLGLNQLAQFPDMLKKKVAQLNQKNYDKLKYEFYDPSADESLLAEVQKYKIMNVKWPTLANGSVPAGDGAIGMVMEFGDHSMLIPLLQVIKIPIIGTQYKLLTADQAEEQINSNIEALIDINQDLGFVAGNGSLDLAGRTPMGQNVRQNQNTVLNFRSIVSENYSLKPVDVENEPIPDSLNSIVIARPTTPFSEYALFQIDQFLMKGKNLILFLDPFIELQPANQQGAGMGGQQKAFVPLDTGLEKLLKHYGISMKPAYVMDENCFMQDLPAQLGGGQRAIYFAPIIKNRFINKDLDFMKNIKGMITVKIAPLETDSARLTANDLKAIRLISSSEKSWELSGQISLNPMFHQPPKSKEEMQSKALAYILAGEFPSYFVDKPIPVKTVDEGDQKASDGQPDESTEQSRSSVEESTIDLSKITADGQFLPKGKPGKIFLMASGEMLKDNILDASGTGPNATYILNVIDYMNGREDIAIMRGKRQRFNPLDDASAATRTFTKTANIVGLPALVVLFGIAVWFRRHTRKKNIQAMFQKP